MRALGSLRLSSLLLSFPPFSALDEVLIPAHSLPLTVHRSLVNGSQLTAHCSLFSILPPQMRCRTGFPDDPVTVQVGSDFSAHRVFTKQAPDPADGSYD